jgi:hypothetical protein
VAENMEDEKIKSDGQTWNTWNKCW